MNEELQVFNNQELGLQARMMLNQDGSISIKAEDAAIGFGWIQKKKDKIYPRWETLNGYCRELGFSQQVGKDDYLPESLYYLLGMKASNEKAQKYQRWLAMDVLPSLRKTGSYKICSKEQKNDRTEIMMMNARSRMAQTYLKLAQVDTLSSTYKNVLVSKASEVLAGEKIVPLPAIEQRQAYSAKEIGDMFGISANKVGRIANANNLKVEEYGEYRRDKSKHSVKEVDTWVYFDTVIPIFRKLLNVGVA